MSQFVSSRAGQAVNVEGPQCVIARVPHYGVAVSPDATIMPLTHVDPMTLELLGTADRPYPVAVHALYPLQATRKRPSSTS
mmetsp:Transcript_10454/g.20459  ORF Transcript_10454/g.20459 Transcript_10454/m.20459 type:complete len:81 (+) Transcript_10454:202-444(+)